MKKFIGQKFIFLTLAFFIILFGSFFVIKNAKADSIYLDSSNWVRHDNTNSWTVNNRNYSTIFNVSSTCSNPILIYNNNSRGNNKGIDISSIYVSKNGINLTGIHSDNVSTNSQMTDYNSGYYLLEGGVEYEIGFSQIGGEYDFMSFNYDIFCNVNPDNPVYYSLTDIGSNSYQIPATNSNNSGNIWYLGGFNLVSDFANTTYDYANSWYQIYKSQYDLANNFTNAFDIIKNSDNSPFNFSIYNFNYKAPLAPPPALEVKIFQEPLNVKIGNDLDVSFYFDFGDLYDDIDNAYFGFSQDCAGNFCYESYSDILWLKRDFWNVDYRFGSKTFTIDKRDLENLTGNESFYIEYVIGDEVFTHLIPFNYNLKSNNWLKSGVVSPLKINLETWKETTTLIGFNYDFTGLEYLNSKVCLYNYGGKNSTGYCVDITKPKSYGLIEIPIPETPVSFDFYFQSDITSLLKSNAFVIDFYNNSKPPFKALSNRDLACSEEEWNTPDPVFGIDWLSATTSIPAFNLTVLKCKTIETAFNITDNIGDFFSNSLNWAINQIKSIFPFNIPAKIYDSWKSSANKDLPENLDFLEQFDKNGNISLDLSSLTGTTTNEIVVFGPNIIENDAWTNTIKGIREFLKYFFWAFFIYFAVFKRGERVYYRLKDEI